MRTRTTLVPAIAVVAAAAHRAAAQHPGRAAGARDRARTAARAGAVGPREQADVDRHPIGFTYDAVTQRIWVASYGGTLAVFDDAAP